jgi:hypothetical protein
MEHADSLLRMWKKFGVCRQTDLANTTILLIFIRTILFVCSLLLHRNKCTTSTNAEYLLFSGFIIFFSVNFIFASLVSMAYEAINLDRQQTLRITQAWTNEL